jgi:hypothetical protein
MAGFFAILLAALATGCPPVTPEAARAEVIKK